MIYTITLNPAIDRTVAVDELVPGTVMRTLGVTICAGGKGINVSRALHAAGSDTTAFFFKGGMEGELLCNLLTEEGVKIQTVDTACSTRISMQISEKSGRFSNLNDVGGPIAPSELSALISVLEACIKKEDILVLAGSVPKGIPTNIYGDLVALFAPLCSAVVVDADGDALIAACEARPFLIKPNEHELARFAGREFTDFEDMIAFGKSIAGKVADHILLTLGADGACYLSADRVLRADPLEVKAISTVGAGDTFLAGFLSRLEQKETPESCLAFATALSNAKVTLPGTTMPEKALYEHLLPLTKVYEI